MNSCQNLIPEAERPRERCLANGPECLSLRECLSLLIDTGNTKDNGPDAASLLLARLGPNLPEPELQRAFFAAFESSPRACFSEIPAFDPASQARVLAAFELARRYSMIRVAATRRPARARHFFVEFAREATLKVPLDFRNSPQEWLAFVPIFGSGQVGGFCVVERGTRTHVNFDPIELFAHVLALRPKGFFLMHNHPSGNVDPSPQDLELTDRVRKTAADLGTRLYGHRIITPAAEGWAEKGLALS